MTSKFFLVAQREYLTRVRKRTFIILTLAVPLIIAAFGFFVLKIAQSDSDEQEVVEVRDDSGLNLASRLIDTPQLQFEPTTRPLSEAKKDFQKAKHAGLLYLPAGLSLDHLDGIQFYGKGNISIKKQRAVEGALNKSLAELKMQRSGLTQTQLDAIRAKVDMQAVSLDENGLEKDSNALVTSGLSYVLALLIYMFIFIYGVQIMRGVGEEKTSRVMEVMLSAVKPFDLMMGKIMGIAAVGLTQFVLWGALSFGATSLLASLVAGDAPARTELTSRTAQDADKEFNSPEAQFDRQINGGAMVAASQGADNPVSQALTAAKQLPLTAIIIGFVAYFLGGYLLYGALFGAIGAAVDAQTDTQQFMFPITMPLILSYIVGLSVILPNPDGPVAFWMSMIPFTSPIAMVIRLPFGVPVWQLALSVGLLILGFIGTVWVAARIYRVGVLMYGKKVTYKELSKWMFYKG